MSRTLYHFPLSPASRKVRLVLAEKALDFSAQIEKPWERRVGFLELNPAGDVPVLIEAGGIILSDGQTICEYLEEAYPANGLLGEDVLQRAETRRLSAWFDQKFAEEVSSNLLNEKLIKRLAGGGDPHLPSIRAGLSNIHYHLDYIEYLTERRRWLAGNNFSLADIAAAAHLSALDYIGDVPWEKHVSAKDWYVRVKSRPSFRALLEDQISVLPPTKHYADLDF